MPSVMLKISPRIVTSLVVKIRLTTNMIITATVLIFVQAYPFEMDWKSIYNDPNSPLVVDVGSGNSLYLLIFPSVIITSKLPI